MLPRHEQGYTVELKFDNYEDKRAVEVALMTVIDSHLGWGRKAQAARLDRVLRALIKVDYRPGQKPVYPFRKRLFR